MRQPGHQQEDLIARQAAEWILGLSADDVNRRAEARAGFSAWKEADPRHAEAAARMERLLAGMEQLRSNGTARPASRALQTALARKGRKGMGVKLASILLLLCLLAPTAWLGTQERSLAFWTTDMRSGEGEWPESTLADGSTLMLSGLTAVNLAFSATTRKVELVQGEILVDVARDASRPFVVVTAHGTIRALGTRFAVRREADSTLVTMLESQVAVSSADQPGQAPTTLVIGAGQQARIGSDGLSLLQPVDTANVEQAWRNRQFAAQDMPLPDVLRELDRQRPGRILFDRDELARIKVSAVLPLKDTDDALQLLVNNFPELRVRMLTPYLVRVDLQTGERNGSIRN